MSSMMQHAEQDSYEGILSGCKNRAYNDVLCSIIFRSKDKINFWHEKLS
jgi:hypothetical protein